MPRENVLKYACDKCNYKAAHKRHLKEHIIRLHTDPEEVQWYQYEHCIYKTKIKYTLTYHVKKRHMPE